MGHPGYLQSYCSVQNGVLHIKHELFFVRLNWFFHWESSFEPANAIQKEHTGMIYP